MVQPKSVNHTHEKENPTNSSVLNKVATIEGLHIKT